MHPDETKPQCWKCQSGDVTVKFVGYERAYCKQPCTEKHEHFEDIPQHDLTCGSCGNQWRDGSGDFASPS